MILHEHVTFLLVCGLSQMENFLHMYHYGTRLHYVQCALKSGLGLLITVTGLPHLTLHHG